MPKAIDMHVHLPTGSFLDVTIKPYKLAAEKFFRTPVPVREMSEVAALYEAMDLIGVLLAWDAETATGLPPLANDEVADIVKTYPKQFVAFASVDPWKGKRAVEEIERAVKELGMIGAKFHPGANGLGAGVPGGMGIKMDYTRPIYLDHIAADFPELTIIGAHPSWPWHEEMLAIIGHKANVFMDLSGWSPKYIPKQILDEARGRLQDRIMFGSDYPFIMPERWLKDFDSLEGFSDDVRRKILHDNAARVLKI